MLPTYDLAHCEELLRESPTECARLYGLIGKWKAEEARNPHKARKSPAEVSEIRRKLAIANWAKRPPGKRNEKWARKQA